MEAHTLDVFDSLRLSETGYDAVGNDYLRTASTEHVFLPGFGRVVYDGAHALPSPSGADLHVFLTLRDRLGSASVVIDHETGELVEKMTYLEYGAPDSDYRPERWGAYRAENRYTGKEDDVEVGLTYFGARYYSPYLHAWTQADPLTIHGLGADLNPYAFVGGNPARRVDPNGLWGDDGPSGNCFGPFCSGGLQISVGGGSGTSSNTGSAGGWGHGGGDQLDSPSPEPPPPPPPPVAAVPTNGSAPRTWGWDPPEVRQGGEPIYWVNSSRPHSGSAGGWSFGWQGLNPLSHTDVMAGVYPGLAPSIYGPERQELALELASWALAILPAFGELGALRLGASEAAAVPSGKFYSVAFEMKLNPSSYPGVSRYMHFKEANIALDAALESNPALAELGISVPRSPTGTIIGKAPEGWVWHPEGSPHRAHSALLHEGSGIFERARGLGGHEQPG